MIFTINERMFDTVLLNWFISFIYRASYFSLKGLSSTSLHSSLFLINYKNYFLTIYLFLTCYFLRTLFTLNTVLLFYCNYSYNLFKSGIALNSTQFTKCSFSTLNKFQIPLLIIYIDPVTRVSKFLSPKSDITAGDKVRVHAHLIRKFNTITI